MADPTTDFLQDYQSLARQTWDAWALQLQQSTAPAEAIRRHAGAVSANETLERTLDGVRGYMDWMQGTMASSMSPSGDWQTQLQRWFGSANPTFAQAFAGIDSTGAQGFAQQWKTWMQAAQRGGMSPQGSGPAAPIPAFGLDREQHMQQQELVQAMLAAAQAAARYQTLLQRAGAEGMRRLQDKLGEHAEPGRQIESLKGLYDLWVDAAEEAYAETALTDEFRTVYGEMVNTQMRVRQLQLKHTEALCQQLGMPTRSEISSLGNRLQKLRREVRAGAGVDGGGSALDQLDLLRRELAELKRQVGPRKARVARKAPSTKRPDAARKRATTKRASAAVKPKPAVASKAPPQGKQAKRKREVAQKNADRKTPKARGTVAAKTARSASSKRK